MCLFFARVTAAALALCAQSGLSAKAIARAQDTGEHHAGGQVGVLHIASGSDALSRSFDHVAGCVLGKVDAYVPGRWEQVASALASGQTGRWPLMIGLDTPLEPGEILAQKPPAEQVDTAETTGNEPPFLIDGLVDVNRLRALSPFPQSRSVRGHVLDALGIDNARKVRLVAMAGDDAKGRMISLGLLVTSRSESPGRWHALPIANVRRARLRGEEARVPDAPVLEVDFGSQWLSVLISMVDCVISQQPMPDAMLQVDRFRAWGEPRLQALGAFSRAIEPQVYVWPGSGEGEVVLALALGKRSRRESVALQLRTMLGPSLAWVRDENHRAVGLIRTAAQQNRAKASGESQADSVVAIRFATILKQSWLIVATDRGDLDKAPALLARIELDQ